MANRKRKVLLWVGVILLALVMLVAALPIWFPWVLRPILQRYGVRYAACERIGYTRFALQKVTFVRGNTKFEAQRIEAPIPTAWLWWLYFGQRKSPSGWLQVSDWRLAVSNQTKSAMVSSGSSAYETMRMVAADLQTVKKWLPEAALTNGTVEIDRSTIVLSRVNWDEGKIAAHLFEPKSGQAGTMQIDATTNLSWRASVRVDSLDLNSQLLIAEDAASVQLTGAVFWRSNLFDLTTRFGRQGWIPEQAVVTAKSFRVPAAAIKAKGYEDLSGSLEGRWENTRFVLDLNASAKPLINTTVPPVQATVRATGDMRTVTIETAVVSLPWLKAQLTRGVQMDFTGHLLSPEAVARIEADLAQQPWVALTGKLDGEASLRPGPGGFPATAFHLSTTNIGSRALQTKTVALSGELSGPWQNPAYTVHADVDGLAVRNLKPLKAQVEVQGHGTSFEKLSARFAAGESSLVMTGSGKISEQTSLRIDGLDLRKGGESEFKLSKPFLVSCQRSNADNKNPPGPWVVNVDGLRWEGKDRELSLETRVAWPSTGSVSSSAHGIELALFQDFFVKSLPQIRFGEFTFSGAWTNGPASFNVGLTATLLESGNTNFSAQLEASGDGNGVSVRRLDVSTGTETVLSGQGAMPLTIEPGRTTHIFNLQEAQPINFSASTRPNAPFWNEMAALVGIRFQEPRLDLTISGTLKAPQGKLALSARGIELLKPSRRNVRLEDLTANLTLAEGRAKLDQFRVLAQGQPITANGEFPLTGKFTGSPVTMIDWNRATARLMASEAQLAAFAPLFPEALAPQGKLSLDIALQPGEEFNGSLTIMDAATQPLGTMGAFLDANAQLKFVGHRVIIQTFTGFLGGGRLNVAGGADLEPIVKRKMPQFEFRVSGANVPLVRGPDVIVRSDVNVTLAYAGEGEPVLSGTLNLRNSFYLKDLATLIPGEVSTPEQRPPFFSVSASPFEDWRVDLAVVGTNALKVRTPYFTGGISPNFKVHGTLREPVAVGEARIASGTVLFPFTNLQIKQGLISLFSDNPFVPQLFVTAASRTFGYDIRMEISGPATQPKIEFTSTPPLTSEQVLLMVTAGVLPEGEGSFTTQQRAQQLAVFLGKSFLSKFGPGGDSDRLTIRSGEYLTEQGGQTYSLEYRLSQTLSIVGEYNRFEELVFSLKWKVYSR